MKPIRKGKITTRFGKRGPYWSCRKDKYGRGIHTGVDYAVPKGTVVVAASGGKVVFSHHGSAFGNHQIDIVVGPKSRDFYAHMSQRLVANGITVRAGQPIGRVGDEGNVTGPHLHFERHATAYGGWSCEVVRRPWWSIIARR